MTVIKQADVVLEPIAEGRQRYLAYSDNLMMAVIDFHDGPAAEPDPPHSHPHEQITYVAAGEVLFFVEGDEPVKLIAGDVITIPSNVPHTVQPLSAYLRLVDTFNPIREDFLK